MTRDPVPEYVYHLAVRVVADPTPPPPVALDVVRWYARRTGLVLDIPEAAWRVLGIAAECGVAGACLE